MILDVSCGVIAFLFLKVHALLTSSLFFRFRAQTSPGSPRSTEETQASCWSCRSRTRPSSQGCERRGSQAFQCRCWCRYSRRIPSPEQDSVPPGFARQRGPGEPHRDLRPVRGFPGGSVGARTERDRIRRVRERDGCDQCERSYVWDAHGRQWQAYPRYVPETMSFLLPCYGRARSVSRLGLVTAFGRVFSSFLRFL